MIKLLLVIIVCTIIGYQVGLYTILKEKTVKTSYAIVHSFLIYFIPLIAVLVPIIIYFNRFKLLETYKDDFDLSPDQIEELRILFQKKHLMFFHIFKVFIMSLNFHNTLGTIIKSAIVFEKEYKSLPKKEKVKTYNKKGAIGLAGVYLNQFIPVFFKSMDTHNYLYNVK